MRESIVKQNMIEVIEDSCSLHVTRLKETVQFFQANRTPRCTLNRQNQLKHESYFPISACRVHMQRCLVKNICFIILSSVHYSS